MKHELLAPAGNMECLKQAVFNGADAVYLAGKTFGARKFAQNFTNEELVEAIKFCHLYDVKVYVTMNTLVKDNEVDDFLEQAEFLHNNGVDAILVQDFGMICLLREKFPRLEIHASTQANTSSSETAELFYKLGVKRVVFSREMSLEEINKITVPIEKEVFVHGALCICYSGCCLMSSMIGTRSGNRGECAGSCRLPYSLEKDGEILSTNKYLLSTKELNTSENFAELLKSNIDCFKIEGRMKSPEYVGFVTRFYRELIDNYSTTDLETNNDLLKTLFNRGFTKGRLFNCTDKELMNTKTPNHIGLEIGKTLEVTKDKIKIKLYHQLNQQDGIRFLNSGKGLIVNYLYDEKDKLISSSNDICYIDNKINLTENDIVCKTQDYQLLSYLKKLPEKKIPITIEVTATIGNNLKMSFSDGTNSVSATGIIVQRSINAPLSVDRLKEQVTKLGETPFKCQEITLKVDENIFIPIKDINDLRREVVEKLITLREQPKIEPFVSKVDFSPAPTESSNIMKIAVTTEEQLQSCLGYNINCIYVYDLKLYEKYKDQGNLVLALPRCMYNPKSLYKDSLLVSDYAIYNDYKNIIADYGMNVFNIYTAYYLYKLGIDTVTLSVELTEEEMEQFIHDYHTKFACYPKVEIFAYGRVENMIIKGNVLSLDEGVYSYNLIDIKEKKFPVYFDGVNTHIKNFAIEEITSEYLLAKCNYRLTFTTEDSRKIAETINKYQS